VKVTILYFLYLFLAPLGGGQDNGKGGVRFLELLAGSRGVVGHVVFMGAAAGWRWFEGSSIR